jgi:UrcA family protein
MPAFRTAAFAAVVGLLLTAAPATAADRQIPTRTVDLSSVDFQSATAVAAFYGRLRAAAAAVCDTNSANPRIAQGDQACAAAVLDRTVASLDQPLLTAQHANPGGQRLASSRR